MKKYLILFLLILAASIFLQNHQSPQKNRTISVSDFTKLQTNLRKHVEFFTRLAPVRSSTETVTLDKAAEYIYDSLLASGLKPEYQTYDFKIAGKKKTFRNVKAMYGDPTKPRIVVGAHYDVCDSEIGNPAEGVPGADDNASGVSGMLELARLVQENKIDLSSHSIEFVAYTLEEPPYFRTEQMGSYIHAADLKNKNIEVKFMVSLEMIGYFSDAVNSQKYPFSFPMSQIFGDQANFIAIIGGPLEFLTLNRVQGLFQKESTLPIYKLSAPAFVQGTDWSDHVNYTKFGYSAIMLTDTSFLRNSNYHQSTDTIDTINFEKMADVVLGMRNVLKN